MKYIILLLLFWIQITTPNITNSIITYNAVKWNEVQCPNKGIISYGKLPKGNDCLKQAVSYNHNFFFNISFQSNNISQLCFFCDGIINNKYDNGKCRNKDAIYCLYKIVYKFI